MQDYLEECLSSVARQTYTRIEAILVNDGSTDESLEICERYAKIDDRICIISQENQGVSAARNTGMRHAQGEFITFVDSDDSIEDDYIEQLMGKMSDQVDLVCCNVPQKVKKMYTEITSQEQMARLFSEFGYTWGKLIRRTCIDKSFHTGVKYAEDFIFYISLMKNLRTISVLDYDGYHYRIRIDSLSAKDKNQKHTRKEFDNKNSFVLHFEENMQGTQRYDAVTRQVVDSHCYYIFCLLLLLIYRLSKEHITIEKNSRKVIVKYMRQNYWNFFREEAVVEKNLKRVGFGTALLLFPQLGAKVADKFLE